MEDRNQPVLFDNITKVVCDDLKRELKKASHVSVAAASFSMYAFGALKEQLQERGFRFIFSSPVFIPEKNQQEQREFYISRLKRENSLYGTEYEIRLRNELKQKAVARECAEWIRNNARFKSLRRHGHINNFAVLANGGDNLVYYPLNSFTTADLGVERGDSVFNIVTRVGGPTGDEFLRRFDAVWKDDGKLIDGTDDVIEMITAVYKENAPETVYYFALYNIFNSFLEDTSEDVRPNAATGFKDTLIWEKLYNFQKDAALAIINKLEQYNGYLLADSVGLGKTFTALAVIKYYECRNKNVLVLCPKKLSENWMTYRGNLTTNPLAGDRLRYDVLFHTDLSRNTDMSATTGQPLDRINWSNYDLVVIDESHAFRNGTGTGNVEAGKENRYMRLMDRIIRPGVNTKVLMLSATPVNNRFYDLRNQLALAYGGDAREIDGKLDTRPDTNTIFRQAQSTYTAWSRMPVEERTTDNLLSALNPDFLEALDAVTIARSRKHIQTFYDMRDIGSSSIRSQPISLRPQLTSRPDVVRYDEVFESLEKLRLTIYTPTSFILPSRMSKTKTKDSEKAVKQASNA